MEGQSAPAFQLQDEAGNTYSLAALQGKRFILYFYPKDNTPGCTKEACNFRDITDKLHTHGIEIFGISMDSSLSHQKFKDRYQLPFHLLVDKAGTAAQAYGVLQDKHIFGKQFTQIERSTFVITENGIIEKIWHHVNPVTHSSQILKYFDIA